MQKHHAKMHTQDTQTMDPLLARLSKSKSFLATHVSGANVCTLPRRTRLQRRGHIPHRRNILCRSLNTYTIQEISEYSVAPSSNIVSTM